MRVGPATWEEVAAVLANACTAKTDPTQRYPLDELKQGALCFKIEQQGQIVAAYLLKAVGDVVWVRLAAGRAAEDLTAAITGALVRQCHQFEAIVFQTRRRGLIKKACRLGYSVTGTKNGFTQLRKELHHA